MLYLITGDADSITKVTEILKGLQLTIKTLSGDILIKYDGTTQDLLLDIGAIQNENKLVCSDWEANRILIVCLENGTAISGLQNNADWEWIDNARR